MHPSFIFLVEVASPEAPDLLEDVRLLLRRRYYSGSGNWLDESAYENDATIEGATWDSVTRRFVFDGVDDRMTVADDVSLNFGASEDFTVVLVVSLPVQGDAVEKALIMKGDSASDTAGDPGFHVRRGATNGLVAAGAIKDSVGRIQDTVGGIVPDTRQVFALKRDADTNIETTVNGETNGPTAATAGSTSGSTPVRLGFRTNASVYTPMELWGVAILPRRLTPEEVVQVGAYLVQGEPSAQGGGVAAMVGVGGWGLQELAAGEAVVADVSRFGTLSVYPGSGATCTISMVDSPRVGSHDTLTSYSFTEPRSFRAPWPFLRISTSGGPARVSLS